MRPISVSGTVDAPRERVFDFICDLARRPEWTDHFASDFRLERLDAAGEGAGARFRVRAPGIRYMSMTVAELEPPHLIVERGRGGRSNRIAIAAAWELSEGPGAVTTVRLSFSTSGRRGGRWWRRRWRRALRRLGEAVEGGAPAPGPVAVAGGDREPTGIA